MTPQEQALARRAVACPSWRWLPGMRWVDHEHGRDDRLIDDEDAAAFTACPEGELPDLTDSATLGCLLALVTAAYRWEMLPYKDSKGDWGARRAIPGYRPIIPSTHRTKAAALVAALEAAPVRAGGEE